MIGAGTENAICDECPANDAERKKSRKGRLKGGRKAKHPAKRPGVCVESGRFRAGRSYQRHTNVVCCCLTLTNVAWMFDWRKSLSANKFQR